MRRSGHVLAAVALAAGCAPAGRPDPALAGAPQPRVVATFVGEADVLAGTLVVTALDASGGQALTDVPVERDGQPGVGSPDTVELVTEGAGVVYGGCGAADAFEGRIRLRSFFASACLRNAYAELLYLSPIGHEACNSAPAVPGVSSALGLFSYGTLARSPLAGSSASAVWRFRYPDALHFTFRGRIVADVVPACGSPGLPGVPAVSLPAAPAGGAVGDLDGDGLQDLAALSSAGGAAALLVSAGLGGGRFSAASPVSLGTTYVAPVQTALADVRGSAALDVLYTDGSGNLVVHENLGGGAFGPASAAPAAGAGALVTSDLDADGDLDVAVAGSGVTAFLNAGGAFTAVAAAGATSSGRSIRVGDLDGDLRSDLVTVDGPSVVLAPRTTQSSPFAFRTPVAAAVPLAGADLWDVALFRSGAAQYAYAANRGNSCLARFRTNSPGKAFVYEACVAVPFPPERIASADLDGNGSDDLVVAGGGVVQVLLADPAQPGGFRATTHGGVPAPTALRVRDLDGDGAPDLAVSSATAQAHAVLLNTGAGAFRAPARVATGAGAERVVALALDGDALADLAVANGTASTVTPLVNVGGALVAGTAVALPSAPVAMAAGDVDRDGLADVAVAVSGGQVCVLAGNGAGALGAPACAAVGAAPAGIALLDLTGDGAPEAAVALGDAAGGVLVLRNGGAGALARDPSLDAVATPHAVGLLAADLTGDGLADLAVAGDALAVLPNTGAGLGPAVLAAHDAGATALAAGDLDGDGRLDVATTGPDEIQLFLADGAGGFAFEAALPFPAPAGVAIEDLDGDGALDVAATSATRGLVGVARNRGVGAFDPALDPFVAWPAGGAGAALVATDLDGDVRVDLAAADPAGGAVDVLRAVCLP